MGLVTKDDGWRLSDALRAQMQPLLPPRPRHPLGNSSEPILNTHGEVIGINCA